VGYTQSRRGVGPYLYYGEIPKKERMDVLGLFPWAYTRARDILGKGLGVNKLRVVLCIYYASYSWVY
jgi:hypothetical protein